MIKALVTMIAMLISLACVGAAFLEAAKAGL